MLVKNLLSRLGRQVRLGLLVLGAGKGAILFFLRLLQVLHLLIPLLQLAAVVEVNIQTQLTLP
jgi:hypothetical protein